MGQLLNKQICKKPFLAAYCATRLALACMLWGGGWAAVHAQSADKTEVDTTSIAYKLKYLPKGFGNYQFSFYYYNNNNAYNLRGYEVLHSKDILQMKLNPAGDDSYMVLNGGKGANTLRAYDLKEADSQMFRVRCQQYNPLAFCYASDARGFYVMGSDKQVHIYDVKRHAETAAIPAMVQANRLVASENGFYLALSEGKNLEVLAIEAKMQRAKLEMTDSIKQVCFSNDSRWMAVLTADAVCRIYDTRNFEVAKTYDALGLATCCAFHPENKYLAVVTGEHRIALINLLNNKDRQYIDTKGAGMMFLDFMRDADERMLLAYNTDLAIVFKPVNFLAPNRQVLLRDELDSKMKEWLKRMDGESLEAYNERVNEETRMKQISLFETEIATRMAEATLEGITPKVGNYNADMQMLTLEIDNMPNIYVSVPANEVQDFMEEGELKITQAKYCLNEKDEFELVYTEVVNPRTGKKYVFDNQERKSLAYLENDDNFVPLSQLQLSQMEEIKLQEIRNDILAAAKNENVISDHTSIDVKTQILKENDATGKRITNYEIGVSYTVDAEYSSRDDFPAGHFKCEESNAAQAMLAVVKKALEGEMAKYVVPGKGLKVSITGMADASPFSHTVNYDGCYGDYEREPVKKGGVLSAVTVGKRTGISENDQLAFLRAMGVKHYLVEHIPSLNAMKVNYETNIDISDKKGSEFRRIGVVFTFIDAF